MQFRFIGYVLSPESKHLDICVEAENPMRAWKILLDLKDGFRIDHARTFSLSQCLGCKNCKSVNESRS